MAEVNIDEVTGIIEKHSDMIWRLALCRIQNVQDAEDVYQECFLRFLKQERRNWDGERIKAWLIRTVLNLCADHFRRRIRHPETDIEDFKDTGAYIPEEYRELWDQVAQLPYKYRVVIHLFYGEGYSTREIAGILRITDSAVRTRLERGRNMLKKEMEG